MSQACFPFIAALVIGACVPIAATTGTTIDTQFAAAITTAAFSHQTDAIATAPPAPPCGGSTSSAADLAAAIGAYTLDGETATEENKTYTARTRISPAST